jgi:hypothetical protein
MSPTVIPRTSVLEPWPALPLLEWRETCDTLHMWTQIVGKIRTDLTPPINHWWHSTLYVSPRGLTTSAIPYGNASFEIEFDFVNHDLWITTSAGVVKAVPLYPRAVADFYDEVMGTLHSVGINPHISTQPQEFPDPIRFEQDRKHAAYEAHYVARFHRVLLSIERVFREFRSSFIGKCSPVHFFWGSFDLAVTRFSGRRAPERAGADAVTREAYSHECSSVGWWPGGGPIDEPAFYAYTAPEPAGYKEAHILPVEAFYQKDMGEHLLLYENVRRAPSPEKTLTEFLQSTYETGANLAGWARTELERPVAAAAAELKETA